ncbi:hypothetical protein A2331_02790 [Candidatus Falkowbacteria bacterium RIFOXYB2_FULL_34_18]|uniref:homoserine dehydrogenase n=1 Tax=Candidatus Falkowbacteria bacterium RIFOXYD2_FULL_34_120 TaxID=1798007 RepID=A0A1F5TMH6_9BACT|nr:MAG: hypothetical protein A2331_02790 [Candidatus Falkowbacteria bacterium RIFOXYB2_FULL_34_18]OGF28362.1 MAG: hypothetical protein A2500_03150 [Candidatus Falkowbacteria bacterium RIFOXYC12_FULL_34_55]OGF37919.1 MAG: hypothetical protein A2466_05935 [Candidatus Falkowbacteria bacterium RIFOXYC2_FULL_34_220]OGF39637.1 MAG: hypothetical protein A2515_07230 [Candidatus Falkowbacteria bacterium RIFOXYD12_FULL_34_57]OGF40076.1 MAG: hypothetical protein A2531_04925 [Candidatus Falkowbacteria bact
MAKKIKAGIIGFGNVGQALEKQLSKDQAWNVKFVSNSKHVYNNTKQCIQFIDEVSNYLKYFKDLDIVFLCIPSNTPKIAHNYIWQLIHQNVKVVICEKGAISSGYNILMWGGVGYNATVGGGTMMLDELKNRINLNNFSNIYLVINGTINFILDEMTKREQSLDTIIKKVQAAGYCEPGQNNILDIINQEIIEDVGKKISILLRVIFKSHLDLNSDSNHFHKILKSDLKKIRKEARDKRYVVIFQNPKNPGKYNLSKNDIITINSINDINKKTQISAGFMHLNHDSCLGKLIIPGVNNAFWIEGEKDIFPSPCGGPGAGPEATAQTMIKDAKRLLNIK